ncbi:MAG TPA: hypothetical protein VNV43_03365 [Candidatus Acidoferrales bacterium]|nr:hypothetical protein [Candidatus Acidoferrales bacterium]
MEHASWAAIANDVQKVAKSTRCPVLVGAADLLPTFNRFSLSKARLTSFGFKVKATGHRRAVGASPNIDAVSSSAKWSNVSMHLLILVIKSIPALLFPLNARNASSSKAVSNISESSSYVFVWSPLGNSFTVRRRLKTVSFFGS